MMDAVAAPSRVKSIGVWALRVPVALMFLAAAVMTLSSQPMIVAELERVGLGQWFRYLIGLVEWAGAIAVLFPRSSTYGALLLLVVVAGALVAQVGLLPIHGVETIVTGGVLGALILLQRGR